MRERGSKRGDKKKKGEGGQGGGRARRREGREDGVVWK